ncbi:MAG: hypothetical protein AAFV95_01235 [Bacteroidota bacterium]
MDLPILISKKGTKVVTAVQLFRALVLPVHKYNSHLTKWLSDVYAFKDDIRYPIEMKDFAARPLKHSKQKDFYLSVELARLIVLNSSSEHKKECACYLMKVEDKPDPRVSLGKDEVTMVLELTKVMGLMSCQQSVAELHKQHFEDRNGSPRKWWQYRAGLLGYSTEELKEKMLRIGKQYKGKNFVQMLMYIDQYEIIRMAIIDLFIALGRSRAHATSMGDLAKTFAVELKLSIWDDRDSSIDFMTYDVNHELVRELNNLRLSQEPGPLVLQLLEAGRA